MVQILFMLFTIVIVLAVLGMIFKQKLDKKNKAKKEAKYNDQHQRRKS